MGIVHEMIKNETEEMRGHKSMSRSKKYDDGNARLDRRLKEGRTPADTLNNLAKSVKEVKDNLNKDYRKIFFENACGSSDRRGRGDSEDGRRDRGDRDRGGRGDRDGDRRDRDRGRGDRDRGDRDKDRGRDDRDRRGGDRDRGGRGDRDRDKRDERRGRDDRDGGRRGDRDRDRRR